MTKTPLRSASWEGGVDPAALGDPEGGRYKNGSSSAGAAIWASGTWGYSGAHAVMQNDGNFVVYGPRGAALWASGTWNVAR